MKAVISIGFAVLVMASLPYSSHAQTSLSVGSRGEAVRQLQIFLAADRNIYPEGLVTGYFGPLTRAAVMRLQRAHGLPVVGVVGPLTRALIASKSARQQSSQPVQEIIYDIQTAGKTACNPALIQADGLDHNRVISREACNLLNELFAQGKAAGNVGDTYENRDGLHVNLCYNWTPNPDCPLANRLFPQHMWKLSGSAGRATAVQPGIVIGQASYARTTEGGVKHSIPYAFYKTQDGADILYSQYRNNNLYVYPSLAEDSAPGSPNIANTPYVISSKQIDKAGTDYYRVHDASGSDLPFIKIAMLGLAAFKPEVKRALANGSFLMPTLQMLIRESHIAGESHGSSYQAHVLRDGMPQPAYDSAKLVRTANDLDVADIPPIVRMRTTSDGFADSEKYFTTPGAIARHMSYGSVRRIAVSAADSHDLDGTTAGHSFEWRVLNGNGSAISILVDPYDPASATLEFTGGRTTDRMDVGVFVKKIGGRHSSVPGIVSVHVHP